MAKFVNLNEVKDYLRIDREQESYDRVLNTLIEYKTQQIRGAIGRDITSTTYTEYFSPEDFQTTLFSKQFPIISHSGVTENDVTLTEGADEDYWIDYDMGKLTRGEADPSSIEYPKSYYWYPGFQRVVVTYVAGYATIPDDIKDATIKLVAREFSDRDVDDIVSRSGSGVAFTRGELIDGLPQNVYHILKPYMRPFR